MGQLLSRKPHNFPPHHVQLKHQMSKSFAKLNFSQRIFILRNLYLIVVLKGSLSEQILTGVAPMQSHILLAEENAQVNNRPFCY